MIVSEDELKLVEVDGYFVQDIKCCSCCKHFKLTELFGEELECCELESNYTDRLGICNKFEKNNFDHAQPI